MIRITSLNNKFDVYELTTVGETLSSNLEELEEFNHIIERCNIVGEIFGNRSGTWIKKFIYQTFPEVVHTPYTQFIANPDKDFDLND